mmetsp:Transcript_8777/g.22587  ORF Transcript_8777/g.22587 Transcript_8777/m.22587 type:complete len:124 (-) Transcript_8777:23-394(-)
MPYTSFRVLVHQVDRPLLKLPGTSFEGRRTSLHLAVQQAQHERKAPKTSPRDMFMRISDEHGQLHPWHFAVVLRTAPMVKQKDVPRENGAWRTERHGWRSMEKGGFSLLLCASACLCMPLQAS